MYNVWLRLYWQWCFQPFNVLLWDTRSFTVTLRWIVQNNGAHNTNTILIFTYISNILLSTTKFREYKNLPKTTQIYPKRNSSTPYLFNDDDTSLPHEDDIYVPNTRFFLDTPSPALRSRTLSMCANPNITNAPITLRPRIPRIAKNWQISGFVRIRNTPITLRPRNPRISKNWQFSGFVVESLPVRKVPTSFVYIRSDRFVVNQGLHESPNDLRISTNA